MATHIGEVCTREVVFTTREATVATAARLMREHHVGSIVVVEHLNGGKRLPVGIVTDRDVVVEVTAMGLDPDTITVGDIMGEALVTAREKEGLLETMEIMRYKGVRRLPIIGGDGQLVGIVTIDDLLEVLAEQLTELARVVSREQALEASARR
jgi:CBS domain-containing protein